MQEWAGKKNIAWWMLSGFWEKKLSVHVLKTCQKTGKMTCLEESPWGGKNVKIFNKTILVNLPFKCYDLH